MINFEIQPVSRFFDLINEQNRFELWRLGKRRFLAKGRYAFRAGDRAECVCIVESGHLKILQPTPEGKDVLLFFRSHGEILGLRGSLAFEKIGTRNYSAQACEDSEILCIPSDLFQSYLMAQPRLALEIADTLSKRMNELGDSLTNTALANVAPRIARLILCLGERYGREDDGYVVLDVPLRQQEIADMVGAARQTVSSVLNTLKLEGVLSEDKKHLRIKNIEWLKKLASNNTPLDLEISSERDVVIHSPDKGPL